MDRLSALNLFTQAAETLSFTEAGRRLGLSSSAIGKAIGRLEESLGVRLFHRSTRAMTLTEEGRIFLESCQRIFSEARAVELEFAQSQGAPKGKLRVGLPMIGTCMLPVLTGFMTEYPAIELELDFSDRPVDLIEDGYDVLLRSGAMRDSRLMSRQLGTYRPVIIGAPAYLARAGRPETPAALAQHACLQRRCPVSGRLEAWPFEAEEATALPTTAVVSGLEPLIAMAELGTGLACVPDFAVARQLEAGTLQRVLEAHLQAEQAFRAFWPSSRFLSPKLRVFLDFAAANLFPKPVRRAAGAPIPLYPNGPGRRAPVGGFVRQGLDAAPVAL